MASAGHDKLINVWDVFHPRVQSLGFCKGHKNAILDLKWDHAVDAASGQPPRLHSCSADKSLVTWNTVDFSPMRKFKGHEDVVNSLDVSYSSFNDSGNNVSLECDMLASGSNDCTVKLWDFREKRYSASFITGYQVTSVAFSRNNEIVFFGGVDNTIRGLNIRKRQIEYTLVGHMDTITGISLSPCGSKLLSNAMDNTVRLWDVQPYSTNPTREEKVFLGAAHNVERNLLRCCWSSDMKYVSAGSADRTTNIWEVETGLLKHRLGGHTGSVNETAMHPSGTIIASASSDRTLWLGEIGVSSHSGIPETSSL